MLSMWGAADVDAVQSSGSAGERAQSLVRADYRVPVSRRCDQREYGERVKTAACAEPRPSTGTKGRGRRVMRRHAGDRGRLCRIAILRCPEEGIPQTFHVSRTAPKGATASGRSPGRSVGLLGTGDFDTCPEFS